MDKPILKNSVWLFCAQSTVKLLSFFYAIFLAANLGVSNFGLYTAALAYFALLSSIADFGFNRYIIREGARDLERLPGLISSTIVLRVCLTLILLVIFIIWLSLFDKDITRVNISLLAALAILPQSMALTFDAALVAKQQIRLSALGLLGLPISAFLLGVYFVSSGFGLYGATIALVLGEIVYAAVLFRLLGGNKITSIKMLSLSQIKVILKGSLPYAVLGVLGLLYFRVDALMLSYMKGSEQTGLYGAAYKYLEAAVFIPSALATAMFPVLARLHSQDSGEVKRLYFASLKILGLISLPLLAGYYFILPYVIIFFLPQYLPSIEAIRILAFAIPFMFLHVPGALVLISSEKYLKPVIYLSLVTVTFNVVLNLILIPQYGFIGASVVTVLSEILSFIVFFGLLYFKLLKHA